VTDKLQLLLVWSLVSTSQVWRRLFCCGSSTQSFTGWTCLSESYTNSRHNVRLSERQITSAVDGPPSTAVWRLINEASSIRCSTIPGCSAMPAQHIRPARAFSVAGPSVWNSLPDSLRYPSVKDPHILLKHLACQGCYMTMRLQVTFGLDGPVLAWFHSYLHGRSQCVRRGMYKSPYMCNSSARSHRAQFPAQSYSSCTLLILLRWLSNMVSVLICTRMILRYMAQPDHRLYMIFSNICRRA